jgi:hypothetical protein
VTIVGFIPGPSFALATAADDRSTRWCFQCRKHLPHTWALLDDPPERQPSWYDPVPVLRCSGCGGDHTDFGGFRDGPACPSETVAAALSAGARETLNSPEYAAALSRDGSSDDVDPGAAPSSKKRRDA